MIPETTILIESWEEMLGMIDNMVRDIRVIVG